MSRFLAPRRPAPPRLAFVLSAFLPLCASAQLHFDEPRAEATAAPGEKTLEVSFSFQNTGEKPVRVLDLSANCGCTVPELAEKNYAPGAKGVLKARFDVADRKGTHVKLITVRTDAGDHTLELVAHIPERVEISPRLIVFRPDGPEEARVKVSFRSDAPVTEVTLEPLAGPYEAALETGRQGTDYTVAVRRVREAATSEERRAALVIRSRGASGTAYTDTVYIRYR